MPKFSAARWVSARWWPLWGAVSLFAFSLAVFWRGLAPSVVNIFDDSLEFPLVVHQLAIAHPTGYPLYTLLGKLFSLPNPNNVAFQLNLMSAVFGALAVAMVYLCGLSLLSPPNNPAPPRPAHHAGAIFGAGLFGCGPIFFSQATFTEVYTLNAFLVATALWLTLRHRWLGVALVFGLGLAHHRTIVLLAPAVALYALSHAEFRRRWQYWLPRLAAVTSAPLLLYLYLPLRGHIGSLDGSYQNTPSGFWRHITGGGYSTFLFDNPFGTERGAGFFFNLFRAELGWLGLGLAFFGLIWVLRQKKWPALGLTGLAFVTYLSFNLFYAVSDIEVFFLPNFLLVALWSGVGFAWAMSRLPKRWEWLGVGVAVAGLLWLAVNTQSWSRADAWAVHRYGLDALSQPEPGSAVVGILGEMTLLRYFQAMTGHQPTLTTHPADDPAVRLELVTRLLEDDPTRPIYLTRDLAGLPERYALSAVGPLIRVHPTPPSQPPSVAQGLNQPINPAITAYGYRLDFFDGPQVRLTVVWQVNARPQRDLKVSARLLASAGEAVVAVDKTPVHFAYPTPLWRANSFISDVYDLSLPPGVPLGPYTPTLIIYDPAQNAAEVARLALPELWFAPAGE